jgi:hypothetical protein
MQHGRLRPGAETILHLLLHESPEHSLRCGDCKTVVLAPLFENSHLSVRLEKQQNSLHPTVDNRVVKQAQLGENGVDVLLHSSMAHE